MPWRMKRALLNTMRMRHVLSQHSDARPAHPGRIDGFQCQIGSMYSDAEVRRRLLDYQIFRTDDAGTQGTSMQHIINVAAGQGIISEAQVRRAVAILHDQGHLYTTVDDHHFEWISVGGMGGGLEDMDAFLSDDPFATEFLQGE